MVYITKCQKTIILHSYVNHCVNYLFSSWKKNSETMTLLYLHHYRRLMFLKQQILKIYELKLKWKELAKN